MTKSEEKEERTPINVLFKRLSATYGAAWQRSMGQSTIKDVKNAWGHELAYFLQNRETMMAVSWALENLPERCPNVIEFKNLCHRAPVQIVGALPTPLPPADPERVAAELSKLGHVAGAVAPADHKAWARRILGRFEAGERVSPIRLQFARQALRMEV